MPGSSRITFVRAGAFFREQNRLLFESIWISRINRKYVSARARGASTTGAVPFIQTICRNRAGSNFIRAISRPSKWILHFTLRRAKQRFVAGPKWLPPAFVLPASFPVKSHTFAVSEIAEQSWVCFSARSNCSGQSYRWSWFSFRLRWHPQTENTRCVSFWRNCPGISGLPLNFAMRVGIGRSLFG